MAKRITKDELFRRTFVACKEMIESIDHLFLWTPDVEDSLTFRVFNIDFNRSKADDEQVAKDAFRKTPVWENLDRVYNYAVQGVLPKDMNPEDIAPLADEALRLVWSNNNGLTEGGDPFVLVNAAYGRSALDSGEDIELTQLADLANVDARTVRNAISAGELTGAGKPVYIENQSARFWLRKRRGYRPTQMPSDQSVSLADVKTPAQFGAFLKAQYARLYPESAGAGVMPMHPAIGADTVAALEAGVFDLPLDTYSVLADFYRLERELFLEKIMEVFYRDELRSLREVVIIKNANPQ